MASQEPRFEPGEQSRSALPLHLSWSALWGGSLLGWACLFVLSLVGASIGLAKVEASPSASVFGDRLAQIGLGVGIYGLIAILVASFVGALCIVRIAGERRRREGILHAAIGWGLSTVALALLAATGVGSAANTAGKAAGVNRAAIQRKAQARDDGRSGQLTARDQAAIENTAEGTAKALGATAGVLGLSFVFSLLGALVACSTSSGQRLVDELRLSGNHRDHRPMAVRSSSGPMRERGHGEDHDQPTIIPPTH